MESTMDKMWFVEELKEENALGERKWYNKAGARLEGKPGTRAMDRERGEAMGHRARKRIKQGGSALIRVSLVPTWQGPGLLSFGPLTVPRPGLVGSRCRRGG